MLNEIQIEMSECCFTCQSGVQCYARANRTVRCVALNKLVPMWCKCGMYAKTEDKKTLGRLRGRIKQLKLN